MNFNRRWGMGLIGVVILCCSAVSAEDTKQQKSKAPSAPAKAKAEATSKSTEKLESPRAAQGRNPAAVPSFEVPTGASPEMLMKFADDLMYAKQPELDSQAALAAYYAKVVAAVMQASQIVLDTKGVNDTLAEKALNAQFMSLALKTRLGDKKAIQQRLDLAQKYRADPRKAFAKISKEQRLYANLQQFDKLNAKEQEDLLADSLDFIKSCDFDEQLLKRIYTIGSVFERSKTPGLSSRVYEQIAGLMSQSEQSEVSKLSKQFQRMAKRMRLVGQPFEMEGQLVSQKPIDWASYRGKIVLVYFWATSSVSSVTDLPNLKSLYQGYSSKGFDIIGVSKDTNKTALDNFLAKNQIAWSNLFNFTDEFAEEGAQQPVVEKYGIMATPYRILVGKDGKVIKLDPSNEELRETLKDLLGPPVERENKAEGKAPGK
ncbi:MAG: Redoxin domain protein [Planctomycetaceae bacterium]|nr:Redoxin domain protein [Planctomycetaceae bacterium]